MARGNIFLGKARGKVGSVVLSKGRRGEMISRAYQPQVLNPKSSSQVLQRALFASATIAGSKLSDLVDHSFDGIKEGQDNRNEFVRLNTNALRAIAKSEGQATVNPFVSAKGSGMIKPAPWILSNGSLGVCNVGVDLTTDVTVGGSVADASSLAAWKSAFPWIKGGAQLTIVCIIRKRSILEGISFFVRKYRVVFKSLIDSLPGKSYLGVPGNGWGFYTDLLDLTKCSGGVVNSTGDNTIYSFEYLAWQEGDPAHIGFVSNTDLYKPVAWAVIGTQYDDTLSDPWKHTQSKMFVSSEYQDGNDNIATYGAQSRIVSSEYYLDQAEGYGDIIDNVTLDEIVSGVVGSQGVEEKVLKYGSTNTFGPIAEGSPVYFQFVLPSGFKASNVRASNGETALGNDWAIQITNNGQIVNISGPMPTTASFQANISSDVFNRLNGSSVGRAAIRCNVSKSN
jgi:hypothetical protein